MGRSRRPLRLVMWGSYRNVIIIIRKCFQGNAPGGMLPVDRNSVVASANVALLHSRARRLDRASTPQGPKPVGRAVQLQVGRARLGLWLMERGLCKQTNIRIQEQRKRAQAQRRQDRRLKERRRRWVVPKRPERCLRVKGRIHR